MHPATAYMQNTSKTCIFTLWRVGKRAFLRILQWENGKIRRKRAFSPSGEWENVHFCAARRGCTPISDTYTILQQHAFSPSGVCKNLRVHPSRRACTPQPSKYLIRQKRAFSPSGEWENVHFCALHNGIPAKYVKNVHFHPLESGKTCISAHS